MFRVTAPSDERSFTSGKSFDETFRLGVRGDISQYDKLEIRGELLDYEEDVDNLNSIISVSYVSSDEELPATIFPPSGSTFANIGLEVHRGPRHPQEFCQFNLKLSVYGYNRTDENEEVHYDYIGSDTVKLRG